MESFFSGAESTVFVQITLATLLGILLGAERTIAGKHAGMRTHALVAMAACLFVSVSILFIGVSPTMRFDILHVVSGIITGIGFIGAGSILFRHSTLEGLTTAAGLWVTAAIGVSVGFGFYAVGTFAALLTLFVFRVLWFIEYKLKIWVKQEGE